MKRLLSIITIAALSTLIFTGCKADSTELSVEVKWLDSIGIEGSGEWKVGVYETINTRAIEGGYPITVSAGIETNLNFIINWSGSEHTVYTAYIFKDKDSDSQVDREEYADSANVETGWPNAYESSETSQNIELTGYSKYDL